MFATGTNWSIVIDFLAPVKALARHETGTRPARTSDCLEAEAVKNVENKNVATFFPGEKRKKGGFFRKPPAFHRLLFMSPFAGDIGAEPGSLKWIAQIPRKACR